LLAGSVGIAAAQTSATPSPGAAAPTATKCWDPITKQVRNGTMTSPRSGSSSLNTGSSSSSGASRNLAAKGSTPGSTASATQKPAGMPDCK
jgi:hypothetical protein